MSKCCNIQRREKRIREEKSKKGQKKERKKERKKKWKKKERRKELNAFKHCIIFIELAYDGSQMKCIRESKFLSLKKREMWT